MSSKKAILIMNRLIINADDFGIHQEVNQAVAIGFDTGILRSTSLLASGPAFPEAVAVARQRPGLGIGIHLCLVGPATCFITAGSSQSRR